MTRDLLLVGCPVFMRAWVMPTWFDHVEVACLRAEIIPEYVFVGDPEVDPETWAAIDECTDDRVVYQVTVEEPTRREDVRDWANKDRFHRMVELRNALLGEVRNQAPRWFLSLDSDILLHPDALVNLLESSAKFDAVGGLAYMSNDTRCPSYGMFHNGPGGGLRRQDFRGVAEVDVIMAAKLLTKPAYAVDYEWHHNGEDVGWSIACRRAGLHLGFDGRVASKHLMRREALDLVDARVGF